MLAARALGASAVYVTDKIDERLAIASKEGVAYAGNPLKEDIVEKIRQKVPLGLDVVLECCGQQEALDQAVDLMKPGGIITVVGIPEFDTWSLNVEDTRRRENTLQFIRRQVHCVQPALDMMNNGMIDIKNMVTHRFPFDQTKVAFDLVESYRDGVMKAMIDI
jgi:L-iditol 2-dehydrogenase